MSNGEEQTPEAVTMKDLWRLMVGCKGELSSVRLDIQAVEDRLSTKMDAGFQKLTEEADIIRSGMLELASHDDFDALDRKLSSVSADTQATRQMTQQVKADVSRLNKDVKKAGISVR